MFLKRTRIKVADKNFMSWKDDEIVSKRKYIYNIFYSDGYTFLLLNTPKILKCCNARIFLLRPGLHTFNLLVLHLVINTNIHAIKKINICG